MQPMAEITLNTDSKVLITREILPAEDNIRDQMFGKFLYLIAALYVSKGVPETDLSLIQKDIKTFGPTEPIQINSWWTTAETWNVDDMLDMASWQTALTIDAFNLQERALVSSTLEQKGVDPQHNKTIFVMGQRTSPSVIEITQDAPICDKNGNLLRHESVVKVINQEKLESLKSTLGLIAATMFKS